MVEHFVTSGQQVFMVSWRNPGPEQAQWGLDAYVALGVTLLDQSHAGLMSSLTSPEAAAVAAARSRAAGYLDGRSLAETFARLRPGDLVWNYWVNNYLLGKQPPAFDVLYWNADTTRMAAQLHADFLQLAVTNALTRPDEVVVLGSHVAALVNPPGNPKSSYRESDDTPVDPQQFLASVEPTAGSWWTDFVDWLTAHSGREKTAPKRLGSPRHTVLDPAPGTYVSIT